MGVKVRLIRGKWTVRVDYRQHRKSRAFPSERKARDFADRITRALETFGFEALDLLKNHQPAPKVPTVKEFAARWLQEIESSDRSLNTRILYRSVMNGHVLPALGAVRLNELGYTELKAFVVEKSKRFSREYVSQMLTALSAMMSEAVREEKIATNPVRKADLHRFFPRRQKERVDPFTLDELRLVESATRERFPALWPLVCLMARTGMRISEALALEWRHVDFRGRYISVEQNLPQHRQIGEPKTTAGQRKVEMSDELAEVLQRLKVERKKECLASGRTDAPTWLFVNDRGRNPLFYQNVRREWARILERAKVRFRGVHALRHTFATLHLQAGASPVWVKEQLGHASISVTVDVYKHWLPTTERGGVSRLDTQQTRNRRPEREAEGW